MNKIVIATIMFLALTVTAGAIPQPVNSPSCITKEQAIALVKGEVPTATYVEVEDTMIFTDPSKPTNLSIVFVSGCAVTHEEVAKSAS